MKKYLVLWITSLSLLVLSLPLGSQMIAELVHEQRMNARYMVTNLYETYPNKPSSLTNEFHFVVEESEDLDATYIDPWRNKMDLRDVTFRVNEDMVFVQKSMPVRIEEEGLARYYGNVGYLLVEDTHTNETNIILLVKTANEVLRVQPNGDIKGHVADDARMYRLFTWREDNSHTEETFTFTKRDALQTILLNQGHVAPYAVGYYTNAWQTYPSILFPFLFPFGTLLAGLALLVFAIIYKKKTS